jgi:LacI family transcriptional regulator, galactose operon repressor
MPRKVRSGFKEVASAAGVSLATVYRVAAGRTTVDPDIRKRVKEEALRLEVELSKRTKPKSMVFLLCNRERLHSFHSRILVGAHDYCATQGWDLLFATFNYPTQANWKELHLPRVLCRSSIARGVILAGTNSQSFLTALAENGISSAVVGNNLVGASGQLLPADVVFSDDTNGAYEMTRYLQTLNHRNIWFVGNIALPWFARCYEGYIRAMDGAGLAPLLSGIDSCIDQEIGYLATKSVLRRGEPVTAVFAGTDPTAQGVFKAALETGLKIPTDLSIAGCNDTYGALLHPPLTTIREYPEQIGNQLARFVLERADQPELPFRQITIPTALVKRESCHPRSEVREVVHGG